MKHYRLILHPPSNGPWNMAVDEAILESVGRADSPPTIRLYAWDPPCLSLGYAQNISDVDQERLKQRGWDLVRRMTGGRAILHADELTYSIIAPIEDELVAGTLLESYQRIARGLLKTLSNLGINAEINQKEHVANRSQTRPVCFEVPSAFEITCQGKKLIGSAQARRKHAVLQHGSLPLFGKLGRITEVLSFEDDEIRKESLDRLLNHATNLETVTGKIFDWEHATHSFQGAFQSELGLQLYEEKLSVHEYDSAKELLRIKYLSPDWTKRV